MKKEQMVGRTLPDTVVRDLEASRAIRLLDDRKKTPISGIQDWKLDHYSRLYGSGKLTIARATQEARVSVWEMMDYVRSKRIIAHYDLSISNETS